MKIAISVGDLNGIGIEIALRAHEEISKLCTPIYVIDQEMLKQAVKILNIEIPPNFNTLPCHDIFQITPSLATKESGTYSYNSFLRAVELAKEGKVDAISTLPINKEAWNKAEIPHKGHTDTLTDIFNQEAIMMIGCQKLFVALFTHHIPLKDVASRIKAEPLKNFMLNLYKEIKEEKIGVLGLNPHAGDNGVIGDEEIEIQKAIKEANKEIGKEIFIGTLVPDTAFTPSMREEFQYFVCMYHDQGLIAAKALYFEEGINVSLNLPIIRTSVDHGTAYDKAYKNQNPSTKSYVNSIKEAIRLITKRADAES
jgi:4-hydroxythreonine-4-phosphate dehydrogenase